MRVSLHPPKDTSIVNAKHAAYVVGVLGLLIDIVGPKSFLSTLLRQTRTEVLSLLSEEEDNQRRAA